MGEMTQLIAADNHRLDAYRAGPSGAPRGGLVIIQEIFGMNSHMRQVCDQYAADGYACIGPALFDRASKGIELGYDSEDQQKGMATRQKLEWDAVLKDVEAAHAIVRPFGKVGILGYCFGGSVAWLGATRQDFACAISYYGGNVAQFADEVPRCPTICHIGSEDKPITADKIDIIRQKRPEVPVYVYEGAGHGFNCDQRGSWNAEAAGLARRRSLDFLRKHVG
jgi:carboxymethylenebutenolidase